jgi:hypothetical protein
MKGRNDRPTNNFSTAALAIAGVGNDKQKQLNRRTPRTLRKNHNEENSEAINSAESRGQSTFLRVLGALLFK